MTPPVVVTVRLEEPDYAVIESEGEVEVCVELIGRADIPVSVLFSTPDTSEQGN